MLRNIKNNYLKNLEGLGADDRDVFLISNHEPLKWDFPRLRQAILDDLPIRLRECLISSITSLYKDTLKQEVEILRGNYTVQLDFA
jgi:hypothetical protein